MMKEFVFQSCFFYVLSRHTNIITDKGFNLFDQCAARCVYLFPQQEECTSSPLEDSKIYTFSSIANSKRMITEIKESDTIAKIRM